MNQQSKELKRARVKATKRARLKPVRSRSFALPVIGIFAFTTMIYAAVNTGSSDIAIAHVNLMPPVTPAHAGVQDRYSSNSSVQITSGTELANPNDATANDQFDNPPGLVAGRLSYRAFGQVRTMTGNVETPFRFNGYVSDGGEELSSPSRYYSPSTGRFTSMDPATPTAMDPMSWNAYVGLGANPTTLIDPDGRYQHAGHYYTTLYSSLAKGFPVNEAQELAFFSQFPDQTDSLDAVALQARQLKMAAAAGEIARHNVPIEYQMKVFAQAEQAQRNQVLIQDAFHGLSGKMGVDEVAFTQQLIAQAKGDLGLTGLYFHRLGDTSGAHQDENGRMYENGMGHGFQGSTPDIIQRYPDKYITYTGNLGGQLDALAARRGGAVKISTSQLQNDLASVANIPTRVITNQREIDAAIAARRNWKALGWMQSGPPNVPKPVYHNRSDKELEALSVAMLKSKINALGTNIDLENYKPELLGGGLIETIFSTNDVTSMSQAVASGPINKNATGSPLFFSEPMVRGKVDTALSLFEAQAAKRRGEPMVVTEGGNGNVLRPAH